MEKHPFSASNRDPKQRCAAEDGSVPKLVLDLPEPLRVTSNSGPSLRGSDVPQVRLLRPFEISSFFEEIFPQKMWAWGGHIKKRALIETSCFASHICCVFLRDRHEKTMGLIAAKKTGGDAAAGDVVVFFDCHVKPRDGWDDAFLKSPVVKNDPHVFNVFFLIFVAYYLRP